MAVSEAFTNRIRTALAHLPYVEERKMFSGIAFLVHGKLCVCNAGDELMIRFDPALTEEILERPGVRPMVMRGKQLKGYAYVSQEALKSRKAFNDWIALALAYNPLAKAAKKNTRRQ